MLHDSPTLISGTTLKRELIAEGKRGQVLPITTEFGFNFQLTEQDGVNAPGLYIWLGAQGWITQEGSNAGNKFYDVGLIVFDRPKSLAIVCKHLAVRAFILYANFDRSLAACSQVATEDYTFDVVIIGTDRVTERNVGTIYFGAAEVNGVFASANGNPNPIAVLRGETFIVRGAEVRDGTLRNVDITFAGELASDQ